MGEKVDRPRGTRDFRPDEMEERRWLEGVFRETFRRWGYREIQTPTFEHTALFLAKSGPNVVNEIYAFKDKGDRDICLRPELTAPVLRFYVNELAMEPKPLKLCYYGPCFRYEEPQEGRYREFWQFGLELIGPEGPAADAEVIAAAIAALRAAGLRGFTTHVGHIGLLRALVNELDAHGLAAKKGDVFRRIDKDADDLEDFLVEQGAPLPLAQAIVATAGHARVVDLRNAHAIQGYVKEIRSAIGDAVWAKHAAAMDKVVADFEETLRLLAAHGLESVHADLGVARGLDYYTGTVFEFHADVLGSQSQIGGGGAYTLAELFGGEHVGSAGFGLGFDRILLALKREGAVPLPRPAAEVYVATLGAGARGPGVALARILREDGFAVETDTMGRALGKSLQHASKLGARIAVIVGEKGLAQGQATIRDMTSGEQVDVRLVDVGPEVAKRLR